jgi:hypothetical protein
VNIHAGVTLGSFVVGTFLVVLNLGTWYPGWRALRKTPAKHAAKLAPFLCGYAYGALLMMVGGLLGWIADVALWGGSWLGDGALIWGVGGSRENVGSTALIALTNGGLAMVLLLTAVVVVFLRKREDDRKAIWHGVWAGILTGTVRGWLGVLAVPLASAMNWAGHFLPGAS